MATTNKIRKDIEKTKEKIADCQKKLRALEAQLVEEENLEIVRIQGAVDVVEIIALEHIVRKCVNIIQLSEYHYITFRRQGLLRRRCLICFTRSARRAKYEKCSYE